MAKAITNTQYYYDIADAIRTKTGKEDTFSPSEMANEILGITTGDTEQWVRPAELPDYSKIDISSDEVLYLTYDTQFVKLASNFISITVVGTATIIEWGTLNNGVFTVSQSTTLASGGTYRATLPDNIGKYVVYRIKPSGASHITRYYLNTSDTTIANQRINAVKQPLIEVYCRLPYINNLGGPLTATNTVSFTHYGAISPTSMAQAFSNSYAIEHIFFESLNTELCTQFVSAFNNCYKIKYYDFDIKVTNKCTSLGSMFYCNRLTKVFPFDLQAWDVSHVTSLQSTFAGCVSLVSLDVDSWDVSAVTTLASTFNACNSLKHLNVQSWNAPLCTNVSTMFNSCQNLDEIDISNLGSDLITTAYIAFQNCYNLKYINVTNLIKDKCKDLRSTFAGCTRLIEIIGLDTWDTSAVTQAASCFYNIASISELDLSQLDLSDITTLANTASFMRYCTELEILTLPQTLHYFGQYFVSDTKQIREYHFLSSTPPSLYSATLFPKYAGMKMYVPVGSLDAYKQAWPGYVDYLVEEGT